MELIRKTRVEITKNGNKIRYAIFKCPECLQEVERCINNGLKAKSCGCKRYEFNTGNKNNMKHGGSKTKLYNVWCSIKQRILNPNNYDYSNYGGRGITICNEWLEFIPFRDWALSNGYADNLEIHRENDGNYEPSNCDFVPIKENLRNRRNTITLEIANEIRNLYKTGNYTQKELANKFNISQANVSFIILNKRWIK